MAFDSLCMQSAVRSLSEEIIGAKVMKVQQPDKYTIILKLYGSGKNLKLLLSAHPVFGRIHLTAENPKNPAAPPMFCMVLRKHLENSRITNIRQVGNERIVHLDFDGTNEIGDPVQCRLVLEIMSKHSNLILLNPDDNKIYDGIRRYSHSVSRHREVLPGCEYIAPPATDKIEISALDYDSLTEIVMNEITEGSVNLKKILYQKINGISPFLAEEIIAEAGLTSETPDTFGEYEYTRLWQAVSKIESIKETGSFQPVLLKNDFQYYDYYPIPLVSVPEEQQIPQNNISEMLDFYYKIIHEQGSFQGKHRELLKLVKKEEQRLTKKIALQEADYTSTVNAERFKEMGDLLTTYLYMLEKGMTEITLNSFYDENKEVKIPLKPELPPMENIKRYYHKFNKAKNSQHQIEDHLNQNKVELEYIESLLLELDNAVTLQNLEEIKNELTESGYLKAKTDKKQKAQKTKAEELPPREYIASDGHKILVGRNNKQNDKLTLKIARKNDIWLHTQKIPGSHVIIKKQPEQPISDVALLEAAQLAAYHSKARLSAQVPVDYTSVSQVKKPNGAKPGMVIYFQQKTLYVTPKEI
ncbi:MAG: Rqc2 family fibronectin-binding protein [Bacillota bacterium]|jgi:predicted ribosome quality control (RQC) complex YloA/Tae2 family protein